jgi:NADPH-dependent glutamate synthase beta subunit-like oxidoreductase/NAD(P)H-flavin reductase
MKLGFGISFEQLYDRDGLIALDKAFVSALCTSNAGIHNRLVTARATPSGLSEKEHSQLIIDTAPHVEDFLAELFGIHSELTALKEMHFELAPLYSCKRLFVQRRALKGVKPEDAEKYDGESLWKQLSLVGTGNIELSFARAVMRWLDKEAENRESLEIAAQYAAWATYSATGKEKHAKGILFKTPRKLDSYHLVPVETEIVEGVTVLKSHHHRHREGFALTDDGGSLEKALDETNYCIWCHNQGKDSCSKGLKEKEGGFKKSALDIPLAGCPLEEKISEMNFLKSEGVPIGALAVITIDNPMCAGTGHRICNDCMKSCIYQKQDPVNIPQAETRTLKDILELPYGFEIYSLLTRWNPLNIHRPIPKASTNKKVLIAGLGPAGYTLAHHLMNDGHTVAGVDGLKIEPIDPTISGVDAMGNPVPFQPIRDISHLRESLDERVLAGFGGVAEYGITVRWDKNYLKIIRLLLERRRQFSMTGGVRFGSTITIESAWKLGFDHIALCMGAGKPTVLDIPNGLARGVRAASDFLMALQLTGAAKTDSIANLQLRLPVVVIGGGLTAIDTATESLAYYPRQVEKFLSRYEYLSQQKGESVVRARWSEEEKAIAEEFITHAKAIRLERQKASREKRLPDLLSLLNTWGGVKIAYRKRMVDAPSYRLNHEEVELALQEGIGFCENLEPTAINVDRFGHAESITCKHADGSTSTLTARTILVAAGTSPNTVLQREFPGSITLHGKYFQAIDETGNPVSPQKSAKPETPQVLLARESDGRAISFFGDLHPSFAGNVVKAMGSAKQGYPVVSRVLSEKNAQNESGSLFLKRLNSLLRPTVHAVNRLTPNIIEVVLHAPLAAERFEPGQFYRLQNFESNAMHIRDTTLAMEGLAMTGAWVNKEQGLLATIILEMGGSSDLCAHLKPGEPVILMGPTGTPTEIPENSTVMLIGGGLGNAVLFSIGKALREKNSKVLYFAGYKKAIDRYKVEEIEGASDVVVWCCDEPSPFKPNRAQDRVFHGNIVDAVAAYAEGGTGPVTIPTEQVDHIIAIGSDRMMAAVSKARHSVLKPYLKPGHTAIGSINSPMQCMMKEICAQCLQQQVNPETGEITYVYSCFNQDQSLDSVSWPFLNQRLMQNSVQEKLTAQWIDACLTELQLRKQAA